MGYLLLAIFCSAMISITMRLGSGKVGSHFSMLAANYLVCGILGAVYADFSLLATETDGLGLTVGLAVLNGAMLLGGLILLQISTRKNGVVLSSVFMKLGLLVSLVCSILVFGEAPTWLQAVGFVLAIGAIVLINLGTGGGRASSKWMLILLLLAGGGGDVMAKVFETWGNPALADPFLFYVFLIALILCVVLVIVKRERPRGQEWLFGTLIGIPNFFSAKFLLMALGELPAVIVYPTFSVSTILVVTLAGVLFFKERLARRQWVALAIILAALVLLNI